MSIDSNALVEEGTPTYLASGDPDLADYYPAGLDNVADDATVECSMLDGAVQGPEGVRAIVTAIRAFYGDSQEFHFTGPCGDGGWLEDYIARVDDKPLDPLSTAQGVALTPSQTTRRTPKQGFCRAT